MLLNFMRRYEVKKALDLLETVKHMMIENGLDAVPQSLIKKAIDKSIAQLEALETKSCEGCKHKPNDGECYYEPCGTCARFFYDHYSQKE